MSTEEKIEEPVPKSSMGFLDHLEELRRRLIKSVLSVIICAIGAFYFSTELMEFIKIPLDGQVQLYNIQVTGSFYAYLKVSLIVGILAALPIIFFQMWSFISPGLYRRERMAILPLVFFSTILFAMGGSFCFKIVLPLSFTFLIGFSGETIVNTITIGSYISFVGLLLMAFGFGFQLPILAYFLGKMGIVTPRMLQKGRRYALVGILIVGAIITPPDVFTQFLLAVPLYVLYEVSILVVKSTGKRQGEQSDQSGGPLFWLTGIYLGLALVQGVVILINERLLDSTNSFLSLVSSALFTLHYPAVWLSDLLLRLSGTSANLYAAILAYTILCYLQWLLIFSIAKGIYRGIKGSEQPAETDA
ncbi:MAG: twin-arginine translocase subunit TatC [bacterium]|nr:twin-arginine translocase subunit TatC [bacterium]